MNDDHQIHPTPFLASLTASDSTPHNHICNKSQSSFSRIRTLTNTSWFPPNKRRAQKLSQDGDHGPLPPQVKLVLYNVQENQRTVPMSCAPSGAIKLSLARSICTHYPNFTRLSIDAYTFSHHGIFAIDYPGRKNYPILQDEAREWVIGELGVKKRVLNHITGFQIQVRIDRE